MPGFSRRSAPSMMPRRGGSSCLRSEPLSEARPKPLVLSFLLCDHVIKEAGTGKWSAIGIFDQIVVDASFPVVHPSLAMYCRLTDAEGEYDLTIDIGRLVESGYEVIAHAEGLKLQARDRTRTGDFGIVTRNLLFPAPGRYQVRLLSRGELLGEYPLMVRAREPAKEEKDPD